MADLKNYFMAVENKNGVWVGEDEIAYLSNKSGVYQIWKISLKDRAPRQLTFYKERIMTLKAVPGRKDLLFTADKGGDEQSQIYLLKDGTNEAHNLTADPGSRFFLGGIDTVSDTIYFSCNQLSKACFDICKLKLGSEKIEMVLKNNDHYNTPESVSPDGKYMLFNKMNAISDNRMYIIDLKTGEYHDIYPKGHNAQYQDAAWKSDSSGFFVTTDEASEFEYVAYYDIAKGLLTDFYHDDWDISCVALSPDCRYLAMISNANGYGKIRIMDMDTGRLLHTPCPPQGFINIYSEISWCPVGHKLLFTFSSGTRPMNLWILDIDKDSVYSLIENTPFGIDKGELIEPEPEEFCSFDGLKVPYWFYRTNKKKEEIPPLVIEIHGGPEGQEFPRYSPLIEYLLSQGFNVVAPNVRGSTGYGKKYHHLDDVEKRMDSVRDVAALVDHLIKSGKARLGSIACMGASYGGFMTLSCIANYPKLFAAAVDTVGISDLETFLLNTSDYRRAHRESEYGTLAHDREVLRRVSPIHKVDQIETPLMVIHGANDPRVPIGQAREIVESQKKRGVAVKFLCYPDEGHGLTKLANKLDCYPQVVDFLKEHLKA